MTDRCITLSALFFVWFFIDLKDFASSRPLKNNSLIEPGVLSLFHIATASLVLRIFEKWLSDETCRVICKQSTTFEKWAKDDGSMMKVIDESRCNLSTRWIHSQKLPVSWIFTYFQLFFPPHFISRPTPRQWQMHLLETRKHSSLSSWLANEMQQLHRNSHWLRSSTSWIWISKTSVNTTRKVTFNIQTGNRFAMRLSFAVIAVHCLVIYWLLGNFKLIQSFVTKTEVLSIITFTLENTNTHMDMLNE